MMYRHGCIYPNHAYSVCCHLRQVDLFVGSHILDLREVIATRHGKYI